MRVCRYGVRRGRELKGTFVRPSSSTFTKVSFSTLVSGGMVSDDSLTVDVSEAQDGGVVGIADSTSVWESGQSGPGDQNREESLHLRSCADLAPCQGT
jgi:hypothetical protein